MSGPRSKPGRGSRGEWYVVAQGVLMMLVLLGPRQCAGWVPGSFPMPALFTALGVFCMTLGAGVFAAGLLGLGSNLTPLPRPKAQACLVTSGAYRFVRHPIYSGVIAISLGWAFYVQSWLTLAYALIVVAFLDIKSRREERWLMEQFPAYGDYRRRVRKFLPFIY